MNKIPSRILLALLFFSQVSRSADIAHHRKDWKTLKNKNGWSIQYPSDWETYEIGGITAEEEITPQIHGPSDADSSKQQIGEVMPSCIKNDRNVTSAQKEKTLNSTSLKAIQVAHIKATKEITLEEPTYQLEKIKFSNKNLSCVILYGERKNNKSLLKIDWKHEKVFEEILSTFRFTKISAK